MSEIKFRVWNENKKEYTDTSFYSLVIDPHTGNILQLNELDFDDVTSEYIIEQYTGLKDKNGVDIYDGDIVDNAHYKYEVRFGEYDNQLDYEDRLEGYGWYIIDLDNSVYSINPLHLYTLEVIGNIHEKEKG